MTPHFGKNVVGEDKFLESVRNEQGGGSVFGTRVRDAIPDTPTHGAKRASEFGPRTLANASGNDVEGNETDTVPIEQLKNILAENPTFLDSLYEAELARDGDPRPDALRIFLMHETGIKGQGRRDMIDEIRALLGETSGQGELQANRMEVLAEQERRMLARSEVNVQLRDADTVKRVADRQENLQKIKDAGGDPDSTIQPFSVDGQLSNIAREKGISLGTEGSTEVKGTEPAKPDGPVHAETQQPGPRGADSPKATSFKSVVTGDGEGAAESSKTETSPKTETDDGLDELTVDELEKRARKAKVKVDEIEGSGSGGRVLKGDLVEAIRKAEQQK
jgi:hypothetical protein